MREQYTSTSVEVTLFVDGRAMREVLLGALRTFLPLTEKAAHHRAAFLFLLVSVTLLNRAWEKRGLTAAVLAHVRRLLRGKSVLDQTPKLDGEAVGL